MDPTDLAAGTDCGQGETDEALLQKMEQAQLSAVATSSPESVASRHRSPMPELINEREAAKLLGISPRALWGLADTGEIPFIKVGSRLKRYDPRDIEDYVERNRSSNRQAKTSR